MDGQALAELINAPRSRALSVEEHIEALHALPRLLAAARDRDARIAELTAEVASLVRRLGDQEKHNIASRRSLCEQRDRYEAAIERVRALPHDLNCAALEPNHDEHNCWCMRRDILAALDGPQ